MKKKRIIKIITAVMASCVVIVSLLCLYNVFFHSLRGEARVKKGRLDLSDTNLSSKKSFYLDGEWEVFNNSFIISEGLTDPQADGLAHLPAYNLFNYSASKFTAASYRLNVRGFSSRQEFCITIPEMACAYKIYVDGSLVTGKGTLSKIEQYADSGKEESKAFVFEPGKTYSIVIEIAVFFQNDVYRPPVLSRSGRSGDLLFFALCVAALCSLAGCAYVFFLVSRVDLKRAVMPVLFLLLALRILFTEKCLLSPQVGLNVYYEYFSLPIFALDTWIVFLCLLYFNGVCGRKMPVIEIVFFWLFAGARGVLFVFLPENLICGVIIAVLLGVFVIFCGILLALPFVKGKQSGVAVLYYCIIALTFISILPASYKFTCGYLHGGEEVLIVSILLCALTHLLAFLRGPGSLQHLINERDTALGAADEARATVALSQIKPHFMYNSLNTIRYLYQQSPKQGDMALLDFAAYLRANVVSMEMEPLVPFEIEREHIRRYASMEQLRFATRVRVKYKINENNFMLPPLCVQPLVENAIKHGVCQKIEGGTVNVTTIKTPQGMKIQVVDDGAGFDPKILKEDGKYTSIGLKNIEKRIENAGGKLTIISEPGVGTTATVMLPYMPVKK